MSSGTEQIGSQSPGFLNRHSLAIGLAAMFALTWPPDLMLAAESHGLLPFRIPPAVAPLVGVGFYVSALLATLLIGGKQGVRALLRRYLVWRVGVGWYAVVLLGPIAVDLAAIGLNALFIRSAPDFSHVFARRLFGPLANLWALAVPFLLFDAFSNGEEIAWRGYVLPRLQSRHNALISSLILGVIWAVWHVPKFLNINYTNSFPWFLADTTAKSILFTSVFNSTRGSLLLVTLLHAAINTAAIFLPIAQVSSALIMPITVVLDWAAAAALILIAGQEHLSSARIKAEA